MDVLEHIQDDYLALKEWKKLLKPNGLLLISVPAFQHLWSGHDIFLGNNKVSEALDSCNSCHAPDEFWLSNQRENAFAL